MSLTPSEVIKRATAVKKAIVENNSKYAHYIANLGITGEVSEEILKNRRAQAVQELTTLETEEAQVIEDINTLTIQLEQHLDSVE